MYRFNEVVKGIHQVNTIDFIKSACQIYKSGDALANLKESDFGFKLIREIIPQPGENWINVKQGNILKHRLAHISHYVK